MKNRCQLARRVFLGGTCQAVGAVALASLLQLLGIDHESFSVKFQGLDARLTGVERAQTIKGVLA